jgi:hypothetical protein
VVDTSAGLTSIRDSQFTQIQSPGPDASGGQDNASSPIPIGFDFSFDNITYKEFAVSMHGWMVLVDPTQGYFNTSEVIGIGTSWLNTRINEMFSSKAVLLAPWFDDSRALAATPSSLVDVDYTYSAVNEARYAAGLEPPPISLNAVSHGISYYHDNQSPRGRRLIVRWSILSNFYNATASSVLKFEVVIYESGTIEFRYTPRTSIAAPVYGYPSSGNKPLPAVYAGYEGATIGIFMPNGNWRFRDFSVGLGYREGARQEYIYGGFVYTSAYSDTDQSGNPTYTSGGEDFGYTTTYTVNLVPGINWPGLSTEGSIFTFSPPINRRVILPRKDVRSLDSRLSLPTVARTGDDRLGNAPSFFDDRRSPEYASTFVSSGSTATNVNGTIVNYPTTMVRFFGGTTPGVLERQDLFSGDMLVTGSIVKSSIENFIGQLPQQYILPYNESHRPEQDQLTLSSSFYATGSSISGVGEGFDYPLKSKTMVRIALPVSDPVQMPGVTSSIYYYNRTAKCWEVPANSTYALPIGATTPPLGNTNGDWQNPLTNLNLGSMPEDARGFNAVGSIVSSGSHTPSVPSEYIEFFTTSDQTDAGIGANYNNTLLPKFIGKSYPKSVRNNAQYQATSDETFTLPITSPFLIEKATFEIPLAMGPGWFNDQTQTFVPFNQGSLSGHEGLAIDLAGPGLTVALMRQIQLDSGVGGIPASGSTQPIPSTSTIRDLILTGTITHSVDYVSGVLFTKYTGSGFPYEYTFLRPFGFLSFANPAGAVVQAPGDLSFTGSVLVQAQATSVAGVDLAYFNLIYEPLGSTTASGTIALLNNPTLPLPSAGVLGSNTFVNAMTTPSVAPLGRAGTGFQQAGRAILGNEFGTLQNAADQTGNSVPSPFYVGPNESDIPQSVQAVLKAGESQGGYEFLTFAHAVVSLKSHFESPYLVMPGDKLVLSISKMRPVVINASEGLMTTGSHDVQLMPGNIHITLYGSQIAEGVEYHDTLNQPLASDVCHELIGADPVLDQFEPAYRNEFSGSMADNVMMGNLLTAEPVFGLGNFFVQGERDRKISALGATLSASIFHDIRTAAGGDTGTGLPRSPLPNKIVINSVPSTLSLSWTDALTNPSKAYRTQPWVEQVGLQNFRATQFFDDSERYWDSLMPAIDQCFAADGCGIFVARYGAFGNSEQVNVVSGSYIGQAPLGAYLPPGTEPLGWSIFDYQWPYLLEVEGNYGPLINCNWTKAYPFEPRYANAARQLNISKGLIATYLYQPAVTTQLPNPPYNYTYPAGSPIAQAISPIACSGFLFGPVAQETSVESTITGYNLDEFYIPIFFPGFGWFYVTIFLYVPIQGLVYSANATCYNWLADAQVGPMFSSGSLEGYWNQYGYFTTGSATFNDISRALYGFGDKNTYFVVNDLIDEGTSLLGTGHFAEFRNVEGPHPDGKGINGVDNSVFCYSPVIRGWKYGVYSGLPTFSKAYWRKGRFGQNRDMLEQRPYSKFYESPENNPSEPNFQPGVKEAVVTVKFMSPDGRLTDPINTWSSNVDFECTSSFPYIEGVPTNRPAVNILALNQHILTFRQDIFGNLRL